MTKCPMSSKFTIRTSDRRTFRRCLRKWDLSSSLKQNLMVEGTEQNINLWFGTGIHFAMEDYHGFNLFKDPRRAFHAYFNSFKTDELPNGAEICYDLGMSMLSYYIAWYEKHNTALEFKTVWFNEQNKPVPENSINSIPGVEIKFNIPLNVQVIVNKHTGQVYAKFEKMHTVYNNGRLFSREEDKYVEKEDGFQIDVITSYFWEDLKGNTTEVLIEPLYYHGTIDRIIQDKYGRWWLMDFKTAKSADINKLETDDQVGAYLWAANNFLDYPITGFIYVQLTKDKVQEPRRLKNGELSVDKKQKTTYNLLKQEIIKDYGNLRAAPIKIIEFLNYLASLEMPEGDKFIRWDFVIRIPEQLQAIEKQIYAELDLMLQNNLYMFPNPTRDCIWDCQFRELCLVIDRDDTSQIELLKKNLVQKPRTEDGQVDTWRKNIVYPKSDADLIPLEEIMNYVECLRLVLDSNEESGNEFKFLYDDREV